MNYVIQPPAGRHLADCPSHSAAMRRAQLFACALEILSPDGVVLNHRPRATIDPRPSTFDAAPSFYVEIDEL